MRQGDDQEKEGLKERGGGAHSVGIVTTKAKRSSMMVLRNL